MAGLVRQPYSSGAKSSAGWKPLKDMLDCAQKLLRVVRRCVIVSLHPLLPDAFQRQNRGGTSLFERTYQFLFIAGWDRVPEDEEVESTTLAVSQRGGEALGIRHTVTACLQQHSASCQEHDIIRDGQDSFRHDLPANK